MVHHDEARRQFMLDLHEIARQSSRSILAEALEAEVEVYLDAARSQRDEHGHTLVVCNDFLAKIREVVSGAGAAESSGYGLQLLPGAPFSEAGRE